MGKRFAAAWRFLTAFPFFWPAGEDEGECLRRSVCMFPLVGVVLGVFAAVFAMAAGHVLPPLATAALTVAVLAMFSLGLHLDGLADCADALLTPGRDREAALAIMKDSRIGAHGALALVLLLLVKFSCLASLSTGAMPYVVVLVPLAGRTGIVFIMLSLPYARKEGLGSLFGSENKVRTVCWSGAVLAAAALLALGIAGMAYILLFCVVVVFGLNRFLRRRLGGATGDAYGAACELAETAAALGGAVWFGGTVAVS